MAATDILSLVEARAAVNLGSSQDRDTQLQTHVTAISQRIDKICGPVVNRTISAEAHNGGVWRIWLDHTPVSSVTTVLEYRHTTETELTAETNALKPGNAYLLDHQGLRYYIWRRSGGADTNFPTGRRNVLVTYVAGRGFADTASVDAKFKLAAEAVLRRTWKREQSAWGQSQDFFADVENPAPTLGFYKAVDPMVRELLEDEILPVAVA